MSPVAALIVLIIIVNIFKSLTKAAKQDRQNGSATAQKPVQRMPARAASPKPAMRKPAEAPAHIQPSNAEVIDQIARAESVQEVVDALKLASEKKDSGSLGGENTEGESREEHARHEQRRAASIAAEAKPTVSRRIGVSDLRRAVVMSEIRDKPKALRR